MKWFYCKEYIYWKRGEEVHNMCVSVDSIWIFEIWNTTLSDRETWHTVIQTSVPDSLPLLAYVGPCDKSW